MFLIRHLHARHEQLADLRKCKKKNSYFENPRPSIRTTIQVLASKVSGCSKRRTYSYLESVSDVREARAAEATPLAKSLIDDLLGISHYTRLLLLHLLIASTVAQHSVDNA